MARMEAQNEAIRQSIDAELRYHNARFSGARKVSSYYLRQTEARWAENDEAVVRDEFDGSTTRCPYFDAGRHLFDVESYMTDRTKR